MCTALLFHYNQIRKYYTVYSLFRQAPLELAQRVHVMFSDVHRIGSGIKGVKKGRDQL